MASGVLAIYVVARMAKDWMCNAKISDKMCS